MNLRYARLFCPRTTGQDGKKISAGAFLWVVFLGRKKDDKNKPKMLSKEVHDPFLS
jgi:hypothetical protein